MAHKISLLWCLLIGVGIFMCLSMVQAKSECGLVQNNDLKEWEISGCSTYHNDNIIYYCDLVTAPESNITKLHRKSSPHINGNSNDDVSSIFIRNFEEFPTANNIGQTFRNLKELRIYDDKCNDRLKHIFPSTNFGNVENLVDLHVEFGRCSVELDFLKNLPNLEKIHSEYHTRIRCNERTFQANSRLKKVKLHIEGSVPWNLFKNNLMLEQIWLWLNSHITVIDERMFKANVKLRVIILSGDELKSLPWNLFEANVELRHISIFGRELKSLPWNLFKNNLMLKQVWVRDTGITEIDERTFETNEKLVWAAISSSKLEFLPRDLFKNNLMLEKITFDNNNLKVIQIDFTNLNKVSYIDLSRNSCTNLLFLEYRLSLSEFQRKINLSCIANSY